LCCFPQVDSDVLVGHWDVYEENSKGHNENSVNDKQKTRKPLKTYPYVAASKHRVDHKKTENCTASKKYLVRRNPKEEEVSWKHLHIRRCV